MPARARLALVATVLLVACGSDPAAAPSATQTTTAPVEATEAATISEPPDEATTSEPTDESTPDDDPPSPIGQVTREPDPQPTRQPDPEPEETAPAAPTSVTVSMTDFDFGPTTVEVTAGGTVTWTNDGGVAHTASVEDDGPGTGTLGSGETASLTFPNTGSFTYRCRFHPADMQGTVVVR